MDDGRAGVEVEMVPDRISIKTIDIKDCLAIFDVNIFNRIGIESPNSYCLRKILGSAAEQLFNCVPGRGLQVTLDGPRSRLDDNFFRFGDIG